ncbi:MAG: DNA-primase RepB domain-containing protein, partial [Thermoguttaceae bacterium]
MIQEKRRARRQFARFFTALFRPEELVELRFIESWTSRGKRRSRVAAPPRWVPAGQLPAEYDELIQFAEVQRANIYYGVCPRPHVGDAVDQTIETVRCLWCDIDDVTVGKAHARWKAAGIPRPSIVVCSGNGVHAYWLLDQDLTTAAEREHLAGILPPFYSAFGGDHVQNFSRVMRPPGTLNYKEARNGKSPILC